MRTVYGFELSDSDVILRFGSPEEMDGEDLMNEFCKEFGQTIEEITGKNDIISIKYTFTPGIDESEADRAFTWLDERCRLFHVFSKPRS